jgi:uncharacterized protein (DUF488 family)
MSEVIYTIGHSTHPIDEFIRILKSYGIEKIADVRTIPRSRHNPQYNKDNFREELAKHGIGYVWLKELGGLRHTTKASINTAWRNTSFRGYADYMQTPEFSMAIERLISLGKEKRTAIMCAEAVPWKCHRSLIGDALLARGIGAIDIIGEESSKPHKLTPWAKVDGDTVTYPGPV